VYIIVQSFLKLMACLLQRLRFLMTPTLRRHSPTVNVITNYVPTITVTTINP
jgi:hypothetical protein